MKRKSFVTLLLFFMFASAGYSQYVERRTPIRMNIDAVRRSIEMRNNRVEQDKDRYYSAFNNYIIAFSKNDYFSAYMYLDLCIEAKKDLISYYESSWDDIAQLRIKKIECFEHLGIKEAILKECSWLIDMCNKGSLKSEYADFANKKIKEIEQ